MRTLKIVMRYLLGLFFVAAGVNHFYNPGFYMKIMPPYLPWHLFLVYLSGIFEIIFGVMLFVPKYERIAAWGVIAVLIGVFPANLHMALHTQSYPEVNPTALWVRLPLQAVMIAWAYWFTRRERAADENNRSLNASA
ncbi:MAG TPA: MauE/DoxX family redox-associated membrane protein [Blastocatellia bacterium]|nr:MauE/DoxX family redox-associated membrane protein [Blastocatellia bacterium]